MAAFDQRELAVITVEMFVPDVDAAVRFYAETLGFQTLRLEREDDLANFAVLALGSAVILIAHESLAGHVGIQTGPGLGISTRIMVDDVDAVYARARDAGATIVSEIEDRYYGLRDFSMLDLNGFHLRFAAPRR
jgi:uncharacterized glyoxalase superfamily protein PhnB